MIRIIAIICILALTACDSGPTELQLAYRSCETVANEAMSKRCYDRADAKEARDEAQTAAQWNMIGASMLRGPSVQTSCMNIGGIVTCNSR